MKPHLKFYKRSTMINPSTLQPEELIVWTDGLAYFSLKNPHVRFVFR